MHFYPHGDEKSGIPNFLERGELQRNVVDTPPKLGTLFVGDFQFGTDSGFPDSSGACVPEDMGYIH